LKQKEGKFLTVTR